MADTVMTNVLLPSGPQTASLEFESLRNIVEMVSREDTPMWSNMTKGKAKAIKEEWGTETLGTIAAAIGRSIGFVASSQAAVANRRLDNPLLVPRVLSFLTYRRWTARVQGLDSFPEETWPDNIPLLYYSYHIMVGLGTIFVAIMSLAAWQLWRGSLFRSPAMLWVLMLALPFPYIANIAGWLASARTLEQKPLAALRDE